MEYLIHPNVKTEGIDIIWFEKMKQKKGDHSMMKLVLVRHGESEWNKLNLFTGWTDVDLSEKGHEEAKAAGLLLKTEGYDFDVCYTSYLKRAIHTLYHILDEMDRAWLPVVKSWKLNECHYGALQGLNKSETAEKYGEEQVKIWRRSFSISADKNYPLSRIKDKSGKLGILGPKDAFACWLASAPKPLMIAG